MLKKIIFWFYTIVSPIIIIAATVVECIGNKHSQHAYIGLFFVALLSIPISLIILLFFNHKFMRFKIVRRLLPSFFYIFGIAICYYILRIPVNDYSSELMMILIMSIIVTGITYFEIWIYKLIYHRKNKLNEVEKDNVYSKSNFKSTLFSLFIKVTKILVVVILILLITIMDFAIIYIVNPNMRFQIDEYVYQDSPTPDGLADLAVDLINSKKYSKQLRYFEQTLQSEETLQVLYTRIKTEKIENVMFYKKTISSSEMHDLILIQYLEAYLNLGRYDKFKAMFITKISDFQDLKFKFLYLNYTITNKIETDPELPVIIDALNVVYENIEGDSKEALLDRFYNLTTQRSAYSQMGNSEKSQELSNLIQEIADMYIIIESM